MYFYLWILYSICLFYLFHLYCRSSEHEIGLGFPSLPPGCPSFPRKYQIIIWAPQLFHEHNSNQNNPPTMVTTSFCKFCKSFLSCLVQLQKFPDSAASGSSALKIVSKSVLALNSASAYVYHQKKNRKSSDKQDRQILLHYKYKMDHTLLIQTDQSPNDPTSSPDHTKLLTTKIEKTRMPMLLLVGPPGVGITLYEIETRGLCRTYGSMPVTIFQALRTVDVNDLEIFIIIHGINKFGTSTTCITSRHITLLTKSKNLNGCYSANAHFVSLGLDDLYLPVSLTPSSGEPQLQTVYQPWQSAPFLNLGSSPLSTPYKPAPLQSHSNHSSLVFFLTSTRKSWRNLKSLQQLLHEQPVLQCIIRPRKKPIRTNLFHEFLLNNPFDSRWYICCGSSAASLDTQDDDVIINALKQAHLDGELIDYL
ncbi:putative signal peptide protein [Puccinia sorghi]|uniref:Putative signal peptide protein n=1 Tax=Puccinia sorghi TaxID=27349 RepID=A0A0L6VS70_9BASI|nr:putative signal peptide protein [Puccinia sorghi]